MSGLLLGLDFGTESVRALLVDVAGEVAGSAAVAYPSGQIVAGSDGARRFPAPLSATTALQDPADWWSAAALAVRDARDAAGGEAAVEGIGVAFTSCTMLPALADGTPLATVHPARPHAWPKLWKHHGAATQAERMTAVARSRAEPWLGRYGGVVGLEWLFPKILEVIEEDPVVSADAEVWLEAGDWLVWQLTGTLAPSTCQAGYKALWSRSEGYPGSDYLAVLHPDLAEVATNRLPGDHVAPGRVAGTLSAGAAHHLGLDMGVPVSAAVIDAHAAVPGSGVGEPGTLVMVLGTSSCHMLMAEHEVHVPGVAGVVGDGILPGWYGYETGQAATGDALDWVCRLTDLGHAELAARAAALPLGAEGLCAVDWFNGCRTPLMDGDLRGALLGADLHHGPGHLYRAVIEATACGVRWIVDTLRDGGLPVDRLVAVGGLAHRNPLLVEILATVLGAPIEVPAIDQPTARGAAVLAALAADKFPSGSDAVTAMTGTTSSRAASTVVWPGDLTTGAALSRRYRDAAALVTPWPGTASRLADGPNTTEPTSAVPSPQEALQP